MKAKISLSFFFLLLISNSVFAIHDEFTAYTGTSIWEDYHLLPQAEQWQPYYSEAHEIAEDLNRNGGKYRLEYKIPGGSSHQLWVIRVADGKAVGLWSAPNHATYILGEIFAFHLTRIFSRSQWGTLGVRMTLTGPGLQQAYDQYRLPLRPEYQKGRRCNQEHILNYMQANPYYMVGVYKAFEEHKEPITIPEMVDRVNKRRLNGKHFIVQMLSKDSPQPQGRLVYLNKNRHLSYQSQAEDKASALDSDLAKQLSLMVLVDALNSQRDRFGPYGSNMEGMLYVINQTFNISLIDSGGISDSAQTHSLKYFLGQQGNNAVSRFEREVFDTVLAMDDFMKGKRSQFLNFTTVSELQRALGYETNPDSGGYFKRASTDCDDFRFLYAPLKTRWDKKWKAFTEALHIVAAHMRTLQNDPNAFFPSNTILP